MQLMSIKHVESVSRVVLLGTAAALLLPPISTLHAEPSLTEIAKEIAALKAENQQIRAENRQMKDSNQRMSKAIAELRGEDRRPGAKSRTAATRNASAGGYAAPTYATTVVPAGAAPTFVTANKQFQFGAITITPGGFFAADSIFRSRTTQSDINTAWNSIPTSNNGLAHVNEQKFSSRATRFALLAESQITPSTVVAGYGEFDLQGAGTTSNNNQSFSYVPRVRNLYATADFNDYGFHLLAGQNWSLVTLNSKGITPRNEVTPPSIDAGYVPGFEYTRAPQIRITKDFDQKLWLSLEAEASATEGLNNGLCGNVVSNNSTAATTAMGIAATPALGIAGGNCLAVGTGGNFGQQGDQTQYSLNKVPDVIGKVAYEAIYGERDIHLEAFGLYRDFLDNVNYGTAAATSTFANPGGYQASSNHNTSGYGVGAGLIVPVLPRKLDFQASGLIGRGIGRYTASQLPDATVDGNGAIKPLGGAAALVGAIVHVTPSIDLYAFGGIEQVDRQFSSNGAGGLVGYGAPGGVNNYGCNVEGGTCQGATHRIFQVTGGMWDKLYRGSFGELRVGVQYSFTQRDLFAATTNANGIGTTTAPLVSAKTSEHIFETSLRYYPFQ